MLAETVLCDQHRQSARFFLIDLYLSLVQSPIVEGSIPV